MSPGRQGGARNAYMPEHVWMQLATPVQPNSSSSKQLMKNKNIIEDIQTTRESKIMNQAGKTAVQ